MPTYGAAKRRDMIRSVLPSSRYRTASADKRTTNRRLRRAVRLNLARLDGDDLTDRAYANIGAAEGWYRRDIYEIVFDRRQGDKASALERWAPHQVAHIRIEDRLSRMAAMLPDSTVGRHALDHLRWLPEFEVEPRYRWRPTPEEWARRDREEWIAACRYAAIRARLLWVWDHDLIGVFNAQVAQAPDIARGGVDDPGYPPVERRNHHAAVGLVDGGGIDSWLCANLVSRTAWRPRPTDLPRRLEAWLADVAPF